MEDDAIFYAAFEKAPEFLELLPRFLAVDLQSGPTLEEEQVEQTLLQKMIQILDEYHEQAYLLDPFLERMVIPAAEIFKGHAANYVAVINTGDIPIYSSGRLMRLTLLMYSFIKCRGRKTIVNFFPHQIADLSIALDYLTTPEGPAQISSHWVVRYLVLLWLSLISMIPFDLARFDIDASQSSKQSSTAQRIQSIANDYLSRAGLEREAAAILLSKLYTRADTSSFLGEFLDQAISWLQTSPRGYFRAIGTVRVLCEITKSGIPDLIMPHVPAIRQILAQIESNSGLLSNTAVRRVKIKLEGRLAVGTLPPRAALRKVPVLHLLQGEQDENQELEPPSDDTDIPEEIENTISALFEGLQDKDTSVRYAASKHLARVCARLPFFLADQVLDNTLSLFSMHGTTGEKMEDIPSVAEATWHGTCLACAEMARRGLIPASRLEELLEWLKKALLFDIRKGTHSIGSSVRDSASYVLWALARSQNAASLQPYSVPLAQRVVAVSLYDREVHIRRAASAAFQENVGRLNIFPHGIDIIRKTDFFAVGVRKNSFLVAAPQVAEHPEYRLSLVDHLVSKTLVHWDPSMRSLAAQSLKAVCELDLDDLGPKAEINLVALLKSLDPNDIHAGLLGLSELASSYQTTAKKEKERLEIFKHLFKVPLDLLQKHHNEQLIVAACHFLSNTLSMSAIESYPSPASHWRNVIEIGLGHRVEEVQEAGAKAMQTLSTLVDCSDEDHTKTNLALQQQSLARVLGVLSYDKHDHAIHTALACLLKGVDETSSSYFSNVEARRNCFLAVPELLSRIGVNISQVFDPSVMNHVLRVYINGLEDYTIDERGDVGSWIRIASIRGVCRIFDLLFSVAPSLDSVGSLHAWLPPDAYHEVVGKILKQGVERLDNVRRQAGESFLELLKKDLPDVDGSGDWRIHGYSLMKDLFLADEEALDWGDGQRIFPRAVRILDIQTYRVSILRGLVLSVGSKTDSTQRPVAICLTAYTESLPLTADDPVKLDLLKFTSELLSPARKSPASNQTVIPILQTLDIILDAGVLGKLGNTEAGVELLREILTLSTRNVARFKNVQRIICSMRAVHELLTVPSIAPEAIPFLPLFLLHGFPKVRTESAEHLYLVMQAKDLGLDTEEAENILLETDWSTPVDMLKPRVGELVSVLGS